MNASTLQNVMTPANQAGSELLSLMQTLGSKAKTASTQVARAPAAIKNRALLGLAGPLLDRLKLGAKDLETVALACSSVDG